MTVVLPNKTSEQLKSKRTKTSEGNEFNQQTNKSQKKVRGSINEAFLVETVQPAVCSINVIMSLTNFVVGI